MRPLKQKLEALGLRVWFDESSMKPGDSLRQEIDRGLASSDFGVVILSKSFFKKQWTQAELNGLFTLKAPLENGNRSGQHSFYGLVGQRLVNLAQRIFIGCSRATSRFSTPALNRCGGNPDYECEFSLLKVSDEFPDRSKVVASLAFCECVGVGF